MLWRAAAAVTAEKVCRAKASAAADAAAPGVGGCTFWGEATEAAAAGDNLPGCAVWCTGKGDDASVAVGAWA